MTTRRSFVQAIAAMFPLSFLPRKGCAQEPIVVEGPTPRHLIKGVAGVTHFTACVDADVHRKAYLDGKDVGMLAVELDLVAGWVRMFDFTMTEDGHVQLVGGPTGRPRYRKVRGKWVAANDDEPIQRIHFGHVEYRLPHPIDVTGRATPASLMLGASNKKRQMYFTAKDGVKYKVYLNDVEVGKRATECNLCMGWVRMFDVERLPNKNGEYNFKMTNDGWVKHMRRIDGAFDEIKPVFIERIHFGHVEIR